MKLILGLTTLIFYFHSHANDSCANKALDALEKGGATGAKASAKTQIEKGAIDPVTGRDLNHFQVGLAQGAKSRLESAFGRTLTADQSLMAQGYSDAFRKGDKALVKKYEDALLKEGFITDDHLKVLQSRITDPSYNGAIPTLDSVRMEGRAREAAEAQAKAAADAKIKADAEARVRAEEAQAKTEAERRRRASSNPYDQDPYRQPASIGTDQQSFFNYSGQGRSRGGEEYRKNVFIGANKYIDDTIREYQQALDALKNVPAGSRDHAALSRTVSTLRERCEKLVSTFKALSFGPESTAQVERKVLAACR